MDVSNLWQQESSCGAVLSCNGCDRSEHRTDCEVFAGSIFLHRQGVERLAMVVASSIGADLAMAFLTQTKLPVEHAFFDGGQFAQIGKGTRRIMTLFLYFAIKSLYWSKGAVR